MIVQPTQSLRTLTIPTFQQKAGQNMNNVFMAFILKRNKEHVNKQPATIKKIEQSLFKK